MGGDGDEGTVADAGVVGVDGERSRIGDLDVIDAVGGGLDRCARRGSKNAGVALARRKQLPCGAQPGHERQCLGAALGVEVPIARAHREPVALAHGRHADDLDG